MEEGPLSMPLTPRGKLVASALDLTRPGVEYGPLHNPVVPRSEYNVRYLDYANRDYLVSHYANNPNVDADRIPEIDIVTDGRLISEFIDENKLGYIVASHVLEHVPDMLGWLESNLAVLEPGGRIAIAYPDRRFTFDARRIRTSTADVVAAYIERRQKPSITQICNHFWFAVRVHPSEAWAADFNADDLPSIHEPKAAVELGRRAAKSQEYVDCHCWIFSDQELKSTLEELIDQFSLPCKIVKFAATGRNSHEFFLTIEKEI